MKKFLKLAIALILIITIVISTSSCGLLMIGLLSGGLDDSDSHRIAAEEFYELVNESKGHLDTLAGDVLNNWYSCIYDDAYNNNIDKAIEAAFTENSEIVNSIYENDKRITELYRELNSGGEFWSEAYDTTLAYNTYYTAVMNVSNKTYDFYLENVQEADYALSVELKKFQAEF
ncbi:MAG: hypothetical protein IJ011_02950 [Clostridia bacterium]|nr:hypothetical protein [Clostridia bacterium]